jgi:DNA modification methylase
VLDPFMGSGTVGRVCDEIDRNFVGYDLKEYF